MPKTLIVLLASMVKTAFRRVSWREVLIHALLALLMALAVEAIKEWIPWIAATAKLLIPYSVGILKTAASVALR